MNLGKQNFYLLPAIISYIHKLQYIDSSDICKFSINLLGLYLAVVVLLGHPERSEGSLWRIDG